MDGFGIFTSGSINTVVGTSPLRRYEGGWKHDAPSGFGVEIKLASGPDDTDSRYYEGEWVDGMQHGHGIELRPDGRRYAPFRGSCCEGLCESLLFTIWCDDAIRMHRQVRRRVARWHAAW